MQRRPVGPQGDVIAAIGSPSAPAAKADLGLIVTDPSLFQVGLSEFRLKSSRLLIPAKPLNQALQRPAKRLPVHLLWPDPGPHTPPQAAQRVVTARAGVSRLK